MDKANAQSLEPKTAFPRAAARIYDTKNSSALNLNGK